MNAPAAAVQDKAMSAINLIQLDWIPQGTTRRWGVRMRKFYFWRVSSGVLTQSACEFLCLGFFMVECTRWPYKHILFSVGLPHWTHNVHGKPAFSVEERKQWLLACQAATGCSVSWATDCDSILWILSEQVSLHFQLCQEWHRDLCLNQKEEIRNNGMDQDWKLSKEMQWPKQQVLPHLLLLDSEVTEVRPEPHWVIFEVQAQAMWDHQLCCLSKSKHDPECWGEIGRDRGNTI